MYQYSSLMQTQWEQLSFEPTKSLFNSVNNHLQTPQSFCSSSTKNLVNFQAQQYDEINAPSWCFEFPKTTSETYIPMMFSQQACGDNFTKQDQPLSQLTSSLHSVAESFLSSSVDSHSSQKNSDFGSDAEKYSNFQNENVTVYEHFPQENDKVLRDDGATDEKTIEISFQKNQLSSSTKPEKQHPQHSRNSASRKAPTSKRRIRWTNELHESFMIIVNGLGGPHKAKPKAILEEMMKSNNSLSISHIKSHLQKCRTTINIHKEEIFEEGHRTEWVDEIQVKIHKQIEESKKLQLEIRRTIHQQLEMQQNLQVLIQQQRKQLRILLNNRKERTKLETILDRELDLSDSE